MTLKTRFRNALLVAVVLVALSVVVPALNNPPEANAGLPPASDIWCFAGSTALGFWNPYVGAAAGAACLFKGQSSGLTLYKCYTQKPVNLGYGLVAPYGASWKYGSGRCKTGSYFYPSWGVNTGTNRWIKF